jgi:hypothetical protein
VRLFHLDVQVAVAAACSAIATAGIVSLAGEEKFLSHDEILSVDAGDGGGSMRHSRHGSE